MADLLPTKINLTVVTRERKIIDVLVDEVVLPLDDLAEAPDGLRERDVRALEAGELLRDVEGLGEELLDLPRARDDELPEAAFYMVGPIEDVQEKARDLEQVAA